MWKDQLVQRHRWDKPECKVAFQNKRMKPYPKDTVNIVSVYRIFIVHEPLLGYA